MKAGEFPVNWVIEFNHDNQFPQDYYAFKFTIPLNGSVLQKKSLDYAHLMQEALEHLNTTKTHDAPNVRQELFKLFAIIKEINDLLKKLKPSDEDLPAA